MGIGKHVYVLYAQASGRDALASALQAQMPECQITPFVCEHELIQRLVSEPMPDVILYDVMASGISGVLGLQYLSARFPALKLIALGSGAWCPFGVCATLGRMTCVDSMVAIIRQVMADGRLPLPRRQGRSGDDGLWLALDKISDLSPKRYRALLMIAEGRLNKEVAWEIRVTESTVKAMVTAFLRIFEVRTRTELAVTLARLELRLLLCAGQPSALWQDAVRAA